MITLDQFEIGGSFPGNLGRLRLNWTLSTGREVPRYLYYQPVLADDGYIVKHAGGHETFPKSINDLSNIHPLHCAISDVHRSLLLPPAL